MAHFLLQARQLVLHLPYGVVLGLQLLLQRLQIGRQPTVARLPPQNISFYDDRSFMIAVDPKTITSKCNFIYSTTSW